MSTNRPGKQISLSTIDELLKVNNDKTTNIAIDTIIPFKKHPYKVVDDQRMQDLVESIKESGMLNPVIVRPFENGTYEMISGHRRMRAAQIIGMDTLPCIVRELDDDDAIIAMVDANIQRIEILPSERAYALKYKLEALKRKAGRRAVIEDEFNSSHGARNLETADLIGKEAGISRSQVYRYIQLTDLIPELLDMVDNKQLTFKLAVAISVFDKEVQKIIYDFIKYKGSVNTKKLSELKEYIDSGKPVSPKNVYEILEDDADSIMPLKISGKILAQYFAPGTSSEQILEEIISLLEERQSREW